MIELEHISKSYNGVQALDDLSLQIPPRSTTVLIGPSGCGKSTILRLVIGLIQPDRGTVTFEGSRVTPAAARQLRLKMGYVVQEGGLFPHLTVRDNVSLMAKQLGWKREAIDERLAHLSKLVQLPLSRQHDYPAQLSGGQRQRVSLMRALMLDPDVLLLDEPLGALDPMIRASLQNELKSIFQQLDKTVALVTHDIGEAAFFADSVVLLKKGRIVQEGSPKSLITHPADEFVESFIRAQRPPWTFDEEDGDP